MRQCRPVTLVTPTGFDTARFVEVGLRLIGLKSSHAQQVSEKFAASPAWFIGIPQDKLAHIREVSLRSGSGLFIEDLDESGGTRQVSILWNTADRFYMVSGKMNAERATAIADSIH